MNEKEIIAGNKLIAEFMGLLSLEINSKVAYLLPNGTTNLDTELGYHSSWDWLMPVVEKIENIKDVERFDITKYECRIQAETFNRDKCNVVFSFGDLYKPDFKTKIEAVYNSVVEFIKWYNAKEEK